MLRVGFFFTGDAELPEAARVIAVRVELLVCGLFFGFGGESISISFVALVILLRVVSPGETGDGVDSSFLLRRREIEVGV